jgi:Fic family protein
MPPGLSSEECWAALKKKRRAISVPLQLTDAAGHPFTLCIPDIAVPMLHRIDRAGATTRMDRAAPGSTAWKQQMKRALIDEAITSSQLEGASTTREVAQRMLFSGRRPRDRSERMILNNYRAMQFIRASSDVPLTPTLVLELHRLLTTDTLDDASAAGRLRTPDEAITVQDEEGNVLHRPPNATLLPARLENLCAFANAPAAGITAHPVIHAIVLHFWLAYDHPFVDGNGRCARALFYWTMLRAGYWIAEYLSISQILRVAPVKYGRAFLYTETDENDLTYFVLHQLKVIGQAIRELEASVDRQANEALIVEKLVASAGFALNERQQRLLQHALGHPLARYTVQEHQHLHGIVYETARTDLLQLVEPGLLTMRKNGRQMVFLPAPGLSRLLTDARDHSAD